jgi:DNA-binding transcriptional LysR family regulator
MNIQRYKHFIAVADEGNFGRAAARIGMKQPPLSQSIRRLERDLGIILLERTGTGVRLTAGGRAFLPEARVAVAAAGRAAVLARNAANPRTPVRVGVVSVALWDVLPCFLAAAEGAAVAVHLEQKTTNEQLVALADGDLDFGLLVPPFHAPARLNVIDLANEPVVAALPAKMCPPGRSPIALNAIAGRLILFPRKDGPTLYDAILAMFNTRGFAPNVIQSPQMLTTLALVSAGFGASIVPAAISRNLTAMGVEFRPIDLKAHVPTWPVALAHMPIAARSDCAKLLSTFRKSLRRGSVRAQAH